MGPVSVLSRLPLLRAVVLLALALGASLTAIALRPDPTTVATWWPAAGLSFAALALSPRRWWPVLVAGVMAITLLANATSGRPIEIGVVLSVAGATEALVAAAVLHRLQRLEGDQLPRLADTADYFRLLVASVAGALTLGAVAAAGTWLVDGPVWETARTITPSHAAAMLVIMPMLLIGPQPLERRRASELAVQLVLLGVAFVAALTTLHSLAPLFLPMPLLVWAALRFPPVVAALQVFAVAVVATLSTAADLGPIALFTERAGAGDLLAGANVQLFLICLALLAVPTALASSQRVELLRHLDAERTLSSTTLATTAAMIVVTDADGTVQQVNDALPRLTGVAPEEVLGRPFWEAPIIPTERVDLVRGMFADTSGSRVPRVREADVMHADGGRLRMVWNNNVVRDQSGRVLHVVCTANDVTGERTSHLLVRHLFEAPMAAPMLFIDAELRITLVNRACEDLLGVQPDELVDQSATTLMCPDQRERFVGDLRTAAQVSEHDEVAAPLARDWTWHRPDDGRVLTISATVGPVHDASGKQVGFLLVARDVTAKRASHDALVRALEKERDAVEQLRKVDEVKNEFVSTVSHELRTPTTSIVGYTEMLREGAGGEVTGTQREMLDVIARNGRRLIDVANDLLTLAGLEAGDRATWEAVPVDLTRVVRAAREGIDPLLTDRDLAVILDLPDDAVIIDGDSAHLDRVVTNLLSNAVKFTPDRGEVRVSVHTEGAQAVLRVSDTGIGIPEAEQAELFTKFFRSSTAQQEAIPGTGLGLSIIHNIVTAHGGTIEVSSAHLDGSVFTVRLPLPSRRTAAVVPGQPARLSAG